MCIFDNTATLPRARMIRAGLMMVRAQDCALSFQSKWSRRACQTWVHDLCSPNIFTMLSEYLEYARFLRSGGTTVLAL